MTTVTTATRAHLDAAEEAQRAAQAIAAEPTCTPRSAAAPLIKGTQALARATGGAVLEDSDPARWLPAELWALLPEREREAQRSELPALLAEARRAPEVPGEFALTRAQVLAHAARLGRLISARRAQLGGKVARAASRWPRRIVVGVGVAVLVLLFVRPWQSASFGPWRGAYYTRHDFSGDVRIRHDLDLRFDWGKKPPFDEVPANKYSVRWDTCLKLDGPRKVAFQITTDNSARLYVDDKLTLNNWGAKELRARGGAVKLAAGVHHLRVDYQKTGRESHVGLTASLKGEPPTALPFSKLSAPGVGMDDMATCE